MLSLKDDYGDHGLIAIYGVHFDKKISIDLFGYELQSSRQIFRKLDFK